MTALAVAVSVAPPLRADDLPPLLCIPDHAVGNEVPMPNLLVIPTVKGSPKKTSRSIKRISLGGYPEVVAVRWSADHRSVLAAPSVKQPMFLCRFNLTTYTFGPRQDVAAALGNPGTHYQIHIADFDWSRDGTHLVLANQQRLVVFDLKTGHKHLLYHTDAPSITVDAVAWSPNGKRVAFSLPGRDPLRYIGGEFNEDLWVINSDGSGLRRLGHGMGPSWSADGRHIVVVGNGTNAGGKAIMCYSSAGGGQRVLRTVEDGFFDTVTYSPDGRYIAVLGPHVRFSAGGYNGGNTSLFLMDNTGRFVRTFAAQPLLGDVINPRWLTW